MAAAEVPGAAEGPQLVRDPDLRNYPRTDVVNAERLLAMVDGDLLYCHEVKRWYIWNGSVWQPDYTGEIDRKVIRMLRLLHDQATAANNDDLAKFARACESPRRTTAAITYAKVSPGITVSINHFDRNPWLLNCLDCTLELKHGKNDDGRSFHDRPHRRSDFITKSCNVPYDPEIRRPHFEKFIDRIFHGSVDLVSYAQRVFGYALTGVVTEKSMFCLFGAGNNGKTTLLELFRYILGDYAGQIMISSLMANASSSTVMADLADLHGKRFVTT